MALFIVNQPLTSTQILLYWEYSECIDDNHRHTGSDQQTGAEHSLQLQHGFGCGAADSGLLERKTTAMSRLGCASGYRLRQILLRTRKRYWCLHVAAAKWKASGCNKYADRDSVTDVTETINGGTVGLDERKDWTKKTRKIWF